MDLFISRNSFIREGHVRDLKAIFEDKSAVMKKSKSERSLVIIEENIYEEINPCLYNSTRNFHTVSDKSMPNNLNLLSDVLTSEVIQVRVMPENSTVLPRRPVPLPRNIPSTTNKELPKGTFDDANRMGRIESFRNKYVAAMDENIDDMESSGFMENQSRTSWDDSSNVTFFKDKRPVRNFNPGIYGNIDTVTKENEEAISIRFKENPAGAFNVEADAVSPPPKLKPKLINSLRFSFRKTTTSIGSTLCNEDVRSVAAEESDSLETEDINHKLTNIVEALVKTETRHVQELKEVIPVYTYVIKRHTSPNIKKKAEALCACVEKLLDIQVDFQDCLAEASTLEALLEAFNQYEQLFFTYRQFFVRDPNGLTITLEDTTTDFRTHVTLGGILIQRLVHYRVFLDTIRTKIAKHPNFLTMLSRPLNNLSEILDSCNAVLQEGVLDDASEDAVASLHVEHFDVSVYGDYLLKHKFKISRPFSKKLTVFLFNEIILLTLEKQKDQFVYYSHINLDEIAMVPDRKAKKVLKLKHYTKSKQFHRDVIYEMEAPNSKVLQLWKLAVAEVLWQQKEKIREEVALKHQKEPYIAP